MCVCPHSDLKTTADICFLLGSYVNWRKILYEFTCQNHVSGSRSFFLDDSRSLGRVVRYSVMGRENFTSSDFIL